MDDATAMRNALTEAQRAITHGDVPVGAVVVHNDEVIARACNEREHRSDPTAHAEVIALRAAARLLGTWRLDECTLYVTLEPCAMCAGAIVNARVRTLVFGATDLKAGAVGSLYNIAADPRLNHEPIVRHGVLGTECATLLHEFFEEQRVIMGKKHDNDLSWWSPQAIALQEAEVRARADQGELDVRNDFASYRALADGRDPVSAGLHLHNPYKEQHVDALCRDYSNIWRKVSLSAPSSVADLGCGAGYTTAGLKRLWPGAAVHGIDVSEDAIRFARARWGSCQFESRAIDPYEQTYSNTFDFVLCQEFYPFTRTSSSDEHRLWFRFLRRSVTSIGLAVITVSSANRESVNATFGELQEEFQLTRYTLSSPRISRRVPFALSRILGEILSKAKPEWARDIFIIHHSGSH
jgi:tRNA(adenine34) deaminase